MVKELGTFFEEFVKEYFYIKEECEFVEVDYPFRITREDYRDVEKKERQTHWSDMDVLGTKADNIHVVSCREYIGQEKDFERMKKHLKFAERAIKRKFPEKKILKKVACVMKHKDHDFKGVEVLYLKDMFEEIIEKIRENVKGSDSKRPTFHVKYPFGWLIRDLDIVGFFLNREEAYKTYRFPSKNYVTTRSELQPVHK